MLTKQTAINVTRERLQKINNVKGALKKCALVVVLIPRRFPFEEPSTIFYEISTFKWLLLINWQHPDGRISQFRAADKCTVSIRKSEAPPKKQQNTNKEKASHAFFNFWSLSTISPPAGIRVLLSFRRETRTGDTAS